MLLHKSNDTSEVTITTANHFKDLLWSHTLETFMTARRGRQHPCNSPILLSYWCNYTKSLVIPSKGMQLWLKINFRDIRKKNKIQKNPCQQGHESMQEKGRDFFFFQQHFGFPFAEGNQPAAPESLQLVKASSWFFLELLVMWSQVASN